MNRTEVAIAIVLRAGKILICQRSAGIPLAGYWEFPGGKLKPGESPQQCLLREVREEVALMVHIGQALTPVDYDYPHARLRLHPFLCHHESGEVERRASQAAQWIEPRALRDYPFPPANAPLIDQILALLDQDSPSP